MLGLPHQPAFSDPAPSSPHSNVTMEAREGRVGNSFACERCRKHKVRCVPSDTGGICQRCQKARVDCIEHVARRRPARPRTAVHTPNRVAEVEKKIDKLSAIVTATTIPASTPSSLLPPAVPLPSQNESPRISTPALTVTRVLPPPTSKPPVLPSPGSTPGSALSFWESINDTMSSLGRLDPVIHNISMMQMEMLAESYRAMVQFFPFAPLPKGLFIRDLLRQRPILMFSVLTVASYDSAILQLTLSREFRKVVMVKYMNGEKSLDLLQGLLVFIAWHHHYTDPQAATVHMLLQLCLGIAGDLGLDNIPPASAFAKEKARDRESKRAYLGCHYLASKMSVLEPDRTRGLSYSSTLRTYAAELASAWEFESDSMLSSLLETCQFLEDVQETFKSRSDKARVVRSQMKRLTDKWDSLQASTKQLPTEFRTIPWTQLGARIYLCKCVTTIEITDRDSTPWITGFELSQRISCLRAIEQFLDNSIRLAPTQYEYLSVVDWLSLIFAFTGLARLAVHATPMPGWDPMELQIPSTFEHFQDQLSEKFPRPRDAQEKNENIFERFRRVSAVMKRGLKNGRGSPNGSAFEITTSSRQAVSILQDLPPMKPNGTVQHVESLPAFWRTPAALDIDSTEFPWKFLMGTV